MKKKLIIIGLIIVLLVAGLLIFYYYRADDTNQETNQENGITTNPDGSQTTYIDNLDFNYILDSAEGDCAGISDCTKKEYGCGQIICTHTPEQYAEPDNTAQDSTTCGIDPTQPANQGFRCGCVPNVNKCGWIK